MGISFGSPVRVHHWGGYAREARAVFGVCFFMYLVSMLIESCGFCLFSRPLPALALRGVACTHKLQSCLAYTLRFHSGQQAKLKIYFSGAKTQIVVLQRFFVCILWGLNVYINS